MTRFTYFSALFFIGLFAYGQDYQEDCIRISEIDQLIYELDTQDTPPNKELLNAHASQQV